MEGVSHCVFGIIRYCDIFWELVGWLAGGYGGPGLMELSEGANAFKMLGVGGGMGGWLGYRYPSRRNGGQMLA